MSGRVKLPAEAYALAAGPVQKLLGQYTQTVPKIIMNKFIKAILMALAAVSISACGTLPTYISYEGPRLSSDKEVIVTGTHDTSHKLFEGFNENVLLICSNGKSTEAPWNSTAKHKYPFDAAFKPGRSHVAVFLGRYRTFAVGSLWFDAVAGHSYKVMHAVNGGHVIFTIHDLTENKVVGGPSSNEPNKVPGSKNCDEIAAKVKAQSSASTPAYVYIAR